MYKKVIVLFILSIGFGEVAYNQSLAFFKDGVQLENGVDLYENGVIFSMSSITIEPNLRIKNLTSDILDVTVKQTIIKAPQVGILNFSFTHNQKGNTDAIQEGYIAANSFHPVFSIFIEYQSLIEVAEVKYEIFPTAKPQETTSVTVHYHKSNPITNLNYFEQKTEYQYYSSNRTFSFNYDFSENIQRQLDIYNITGKLEGKYELNEQQGVINVMLPVGVYIFSLKKQGRIIKNGKFLIKN